MADLVIKREEVRLLKDDQAHRQKLKASKEELMIIEAQGEANIVDAFLKALSETVASTCLIKKWQTLSLVDTATELDVSESKITNTLQIDSNP